MDRSTGRPTSIQTGTAIPTGAAAPTGRRPLRRARNDPAQYDDLAAEWWPTHGRFAALRWLAEARGRLIPD
ncbi:bifunctional 3-demethylubiquinone 3-O-methyltransferase/2-octaprenyl-6-hydroxy phenol methylase, partial [Frankia sp. AiPs1]|nr:bifunctional 3-demethylubiquinone 3-O-methyltransferase/2-octaprenyl-6-hydroxy phenol methylase [Frankia sp. AiPs1]